MTAKKEFQNDLTNLIQHEIRRRKIGRYPVLDDVARILNTFIPYGLMEYRIGMTQNPKRMIGELK